jgi:arylsulfatase A-like enzyme
MPAALRTARHRLARAALVGLVVLAGCGSGGPPPGSLFARQPDGVFEEHGRLRPGPGSGWGDGGEGEWHAGTAPLAGVELCWSKGRRAHVVLHALGSASRVLRLHVAAPQDGAGAVRVELSGHDLGTFDLPPEAGWIEVPAPAKAWSEGDNLLLLEVASTGRHPTPRPGREAAGLGVAEIAWADPRRVLLGRDGLELAPGTGVVYHLSGVGARALELAGTTIGDGALTLSFGAFETLDSSVAPVGEALTLLPTDGRVAWQGALAERAPAFATGTGSLRLSWVGDAPLVLESLGLRAAPSERPRPNVVFVSVDTLAAQHLSCYGYPRETTPNIDRFAREAVLFEACSANAPWTAPSYLSQFTGHYPLAHEVRTEGIAEPQGWESNHLAPNRWTWAEALRSAGYTTAAWIDNPWVSSGMGMAQGFDLFDTSAAEIYLSDTDGGFAHILPRAVDWIADQRGSFFAFLQPMDPHGPYFTKWRYRDRWDRDGVYDVARRVPVGFGQLHAWGVVPEYVAWGERKGIGGPPPLVRAEPYQNAYDEKIAEVDDYFGELYAFLERSGRLDDSIVILSSDHGEGVGQHDYWFDHGILYDEVLRVPLVVRLPGGEHGGRRVATPVQLVDLVPTVLELVGLERPGHLHGRSLVPAMRGEEMPHVPIFAHGGIAEQSTIAMGGAKLIVSRPATGSYQTILSHPRLDREHLARVAPELAGVQWSNAQYTAWVRANEPTWQRIVEPIAGEARELYDLVRDPGERTDLLADGPDGAARERLAELERLLAAERERGLAAQAVASRRTRPLVLSDDVRARLEALGYLEAESQAPAGAPASDSDGGRE